MHLPTTACGKCICTCLFCTSLCHICWSLFHICRSLTTVHDNFKHAARLQLALDLAFVSCVRLFVTYIGGKKNYTQRSFFCRSLCHILRSLFYVYKSLLAGHDNVKHTARLRLTVVCACVSFKTLFVAYTGLF